MTQNEYYSKMMEIRNDYLNGKNAFQHQLEVLDNKTREMRCHIANIQLDIKDIIAKKRNCIQAMREIEQGYLNKKRELNAQHVHRRVVKWCRVHEHDNRPLPQYETDGSAGMDLSAYLRDGVMLKYWNYDNRACDYGPFNGSDTVCVEPQERHLIPTGWKVVIPRGYEMQLRPRSGNAIKMGLSFPNCVGTIDSDYRGEIMIEVVNLSNEDLYIHDGMRIAQAVIAKTPKVENIEISAEEMDETDRKGGFGSTGE